MPESIFISLIVPVYNVEAYIAECMVSLINQDIEEYEIIVVNDGSTDNSIAIAEEFKKECSKIKIIHKANGGLSSARNYGMKYAAGKYIWFIDSDDWIEKNILSKVIQRMDAENLDVLHFNVYRVFEDKKGRIKRKNLTINNKMFTGGELFRHFLRERAYIQSSCFYIFNTQYISGNSFSFIEGIYHEDEVFTMQAVINARRTVCLDDIFYFHRYRSSSIMGQSTTRKHVLDIFYLLNVLFQTRSLYKAIYDYRMFCIMKTLIKRVKTNELKSLVQEKYGEKKFLRKIKINSLFSAKEIVELFLINWNLKLYWSLLSFRRK